MGTLEKSAFTLVHSVNTLLRHHAQAPSVNAALEEEGLQCGLCAAGTLKR